MGFAGTSAIAVLLVGGWWIGAESRTNPVVIGLLAAATLLMWWFIHLGFPAPRAHRPGLRVAPT
jgi:hypothetical protein